MQTTLQHKINRSPYESFNRLSSNVQNSTPNNRTNLPKYITGGAAGYGAKKVFDFGLNHSLRELRVKLFGQDATILSKEKATSLINQMTTKHNLADKIKPENIKFISNEALSKAKIKNFNNSKQLSNIKKLPAFLQKLVQPYVDRTLNILKKTKNLGNSFSANYTIQLNKNQAVTGLHEVGHAIDLKNKNVFKALKDFGRSYNKFIIPALLITGFLHFNKDSKDTNIIQKGIKLVHDNVGKIAFATTIPMLINEFRASKHGIDFLKTAKNVSKTELTATKKLFGKMFLTYAIASTGLAAGCKLAMFIRDKITRQD